jgi:hypothetical protein
MWSRAEKVMETWAERGVITDSGKAFLIATLDPFHDAQIQNLAGYPDIEVSPSLVRMVKQSLTLTNRLVYRQVTGTLKSRVGLG